MNQKTFEELVKDSRLLNKDTLSELEQLLKEYPFCQTFHLLYTKNLYQEKHFRYQQQLKIAAAIVGDRSRLKHYLEDADEFVSEETDTVIEIMPEKENTPPVILADHDVDYETMVLSTLDAKISREEKKKAIIALINKKFSERLDQKVDTKLVIPEIASEAVYQLESGPETTSSEVLIERFLRDAPRISRAGKEFYNPVNLAARSIEENDDFYTETYATICLNQGNAVKALKIYEKLSLKFPEKSSYFAGLIEKIKKEQNI